MLQLSDMEAATKEQAMPPGYAVGLKPLTAGLATALTGATVSYILFWFILPTMLPSATAAIPALVLLLTAFLCSAFAGIEVMETLHASRTLTLSAVAEGVLDGLRVVLCLAR
jgi:hypothetical protein